MKKKRILILGAGLMQAPAINSAKELGCEVVVVDANPKAVSAKLADKFYPVDLKDVPQLIKLAKTLKSENGLDAVFTAATDFSASVAAITEELKLPGHSLEAAINANNKIKMRECFAKYNVPSPKFQEISKSNIKNAIHILKENGIKFPITVKPADNMGARGCRLVNNENELEESLIDAVQYSGTSTAIAEEFIVGEEFSLEALVINKEIFITAVADRHIFFPPHFVEMGHTIPSSYNDEDIYELIRVFKLGIKALGLSNGAAKGDIFLRKADKAGKRKACVGEIAARLSGGYMSGWTVPYSSGLNITKEAIKIALGEVENIANLKNFDFTKLGFSAERAWISLPGKVKKIYGIEEAKNTPNIRDVFIRSYENDKVVFPKNNVEKCGNVLSSASSYADAVKASENAVKKILIRLESNNSDTDKFLNDVRISTKTQSNYEPNFFSFPLSFSNNFEKLLADSTLKENQDIIYPSCFEDILDTVRDIHKRSIREAIELSFEIEKNLKEKLKNIQGNEEKLNKESIKIWLDFIRGSVQALLYYFDSHN